MVSKKDKPIAYVDEHISNKMIGILRQADFICKIITKTKYAGRDEHGYIKELRSLGVIFVTADDEFVKDAVLKPIPHEGIIWLPQMRDLGRGFRGTIPKSSDR